MAPSRGIDITLLARRKGSSLAEQFYRQLSQSAAALSGHNRWSKIKHDKGKADVAKNKQNSMFAQEITTASRLFGPEPTMNPRLADLITKAKREGFAKASIEAAIARGQGRSSSGASLENVTVEGILPGNIGVIVECETDSRLRTLMEVRAALKAAGGSATPSAFLFEKRGRIAFEGKEGVGFDQVFDIALDSGATDVEEDLEMNSIIVYCEPEDTKSVGEKMAGALGLNISTSEIIWSPIVDTRVSVANPQAAEELEAFVESLQKEPSVSTVAMNISQGNLGDEAWASLQSRINV